MTFIGEITNMSLFVCHKCKTIENTATSNYWLAKNKAKALCSACDPKIGKWHGRFPRETFDSKKWEYYFGHYITKIKP